MAPWTPSSAASARSGALTILSGVIILSALLLVFYKYFGITRRQLREVEEARQAVRDGADYLGLGAVFPTSTKNDVDQMPSETLRAICDAVDVPIVAIGGIKRDNILKLSGSGVDGVALVSAIFSAEDIEGTCRELRALSEEMVNA